MILIDGKQTAATIKKEIAAEVAEMIDKQDIHPHLAAVLVGDDPASQTYVASKERACKEVGMMSSIYRYPATINEAELIEVVDFLNNDDSIHGFIVQLPLPKGIDVNRILQRIKPEKDVDGFHPTNVGRMMLSLPAYLPATPYGIMQLLERHNIETEGKNCVVLGRSNIVGTPMANLLSRKANPGNATVTLCHTRTKNMKEICSQADIVVAAMGVPQAVTADMVKAGAVIIDVGIHRIPSDKTKSGFRLVGDVDFEEVSKKASAITPVPGGVGPMTIVSLLNNTLAAAKGEIYR